MGTLEKLTETNCFFYLQKARCIQKIVQVLPVDLKLRRVHVVQYLLKRVRFQSWKVQGFVRLRKIVIFRVFCAPYRAATFARSVFDVFRSKAIFEVVTAGRQNGFVSCKALSFNGQHDVTKVFVSSLSLFVKLFNDLVWMALGAEDVSSILRNQTLFVFHLAEIYHHFPLNHIRVQASKKLACVKKRQISHVSIFCTCLFQNLIMFCRLDENLLKLS